MQTKREMRVPGLPRQTVLKYLSTWLDVSCLKASSSLPIVSGWEDLLSYDWSISFLINAPISTQDCRGKKKSPKKWFREFRIAFAIHNSHKVWVSHEEDKEEALSTERSRHSMSMFHVLFESALVNFVVLGVFPPSTHSDNTTFMNEWILIDTCKKLVWSTRIGRIMPI